MADGGTEEEERGNAGNETTEGSGVAQGAKEKIEDEPMGGRFGQA